VATATKKPVVKKAPVIPAKKTPERKAIAPQKQEEPKEVKQDVPKSTPKPKAQPRKVEKHEPVTSPEASKPVIASERQSDTTRPRPAHTGAEKVTVEAMKAMSLEERYKLWKTINKDPERFVGIRRELPKKMEMRKDEALLRKLIAEKAPKHKTGDVYYCPYCVDWQVFHYHSWTGYKKCTGCGITSRDFYVGVDNGIFGKE
jgi:hypothetical protein